MVWQRPASNRLRLRSVERMESRRQAGRDTGILRVHRHRACEDFRPKRGSAATRSEGRRNKLRLGRWGQTSSCEARRQRPCLRESSGVAESLRRNLRLELMKCLTQVISSQRTIPQTKLSRRRERGSASLCPCRHGSSRCPTSRGITCTGSKNQTSAARLRRLTNLSTTTRSPSTSTTLGWTRR